MNQVRKNEPKVDEEVEETFPASDPPSFMGSTAVAGTPKEHTRSDKSGSGPAVEAERLHVDINGASEEELGSMAALGPEHVRTLLAHRPFTSWEDLKPLPGFDGETIAALRKGGAHIDG